MIRNSQVILRCALLGLLCITHAQAAELEVLVSGEPVFDQVTAAAPLIDPSIEISGSGATPAFAYFALANMTTGTLKASSSLTNDTGFTMGGEGSALRTRAILRDVINLTTSLTDPYDIQVILQVSGSITGGSAAGSDVFGFAAISLGPDPGTNTGVNATYTTGAIVDTLSVTESFTGNQTIDIFARLDANISILADGDSATVDFASTALLTLVLPAGVGVASTGSGLLVPIQTVPIPAALPLLLGALGGLLVTGRRRSNGTLRGATVIRFPFI
jgi:hypothetical protein